ncbi:MAG: DHH family phosphoesterase [archaeon]
MIIDTIPIKSDVVIIPDAGSNQFEEQRTLSNQGRPTIILDHHNVQLDYPRYENVIIVNNQVSPRFKNNASSGAGVVYKTIQAFNEKYSDEFPMIYEEFADLAAVGIVSDMMDTRNPDNNYIIQKGLNDIKNPMLKALLKKQDRGDSGGVSSQTNPTKIDIAFYVAPLINGMVRFGEMDEKELLFKGFINYEDVNTEINTTYNQKERTELYHDYIARICYNVRNRQNRKKEKAMKFLKDRVEENNLNEHKLIIVTVSKDDPIEVPKTITGLVAMELLKIYKKPVLVLRPKSDGDGGTVYAGSGRGKIHGDFQSLFQMLRDSGLCEFVEGHDMAHGVSIKEENIEQVLEFADDYLKDVEFDVDLVEVDYIFDKPSEINIDMLKIFAENNQLYGNGIPQPKFAFELKASKDNVRIIGKNQNTIKIQYGGIDFIAFNEKEKANAIKESDAYLFEFTIIGRSEINT